MYRQRERKKHRTHHGVTERCRMQAGNAGVPGFMSGEIVLVLKQRSLRKQDHHRQEETG